jgi:hypothetical protein
MPQSLAFDAGSYRDRDGRVFYGAQGEVYRVLGEHALAEWNEYSTRPFFLKGQQSGAIVRTRRVPQVEAELTSRGVLLDESTAARCAAVLEHARVPFISYPYEWSFSMLRDAALLQLQLLEGALQDDFTLKDGTSYNVQWLGAQPTLIDVASFERLVPGLPWSGYRQFCQTALFPLLLQAYRRMDFHPWLRGRLEGITPAECAALMSWRDLFRSGVLTHVWLHSRLQSSRRVDASDLKSQLPRAGFDKTMIARSAQGLRVMLSGLKWSLDSQWVGYATQNSYSESDFQRKSEFVRRAVCEQESRLAWDLGCNTGDYSRIISDHAAYTVACDADHATIERFYLRLKSEGDSRFGKSTLPLVVNLADPSPNQGWRGVERKGLVERGRPDFVLCLALIHHLVLGAGVRLRDFLIWLAGLQARVVIEFVDRDDPMVQAMLRHRRDTCPDYDLQLFRTWLDELFHVVRSEQLSNPARSLYYVMPRSES